MLQDYMDVTDFLRHQFEEVSGCTFYEELFPDNEDSGELNVDYSKPNAVYLYRDTGGDKVRERRRIMLNDTWEEDYFEYVEGNPLALCSGLSYRGKVNRLDHAQQAHALIFDLDAVGDGEIKTLFWTRFGKPVDQIRSLPMPTYCVASGTGLHVYYLLDEPLALFPAIKAQLKALKHDLTFKLWDWKCTSKLENIQYQSIGQSFRMVGSRNEKYGNIVRAFRTGDPVSIALLNQYVMDANHRVDVQARCLPGKTPIDIAKKKWPAWYQDRIVERKPSAGRWDIAGKVHGRDPHALYHWFLRQVDAVEGGHRYYYMLCCAVYASKCGVPYEELREDMKAVFKRLSKVKYSKGPLEEKDMKSALKAYKRDFYNFTLDDIEKLTGFRIKRNKRNGRTQATHIKIMSSTRDILHPNGEWRNKDGRPKGSGTKQFTIFRWRQGHPDGRKIDCERETGLSRPTIIKWWDSAAPISFTEVDILRFEGLQRQLQNEIGQIDHSWKNEEERKQMQKALQDAINKRSQTLVREEFGADWWKYTVVYWDEWKKRHS